MPHAAAAGADLFVAAVPTAYLRQALQSLAVHVPPGRPVVSVIKGIENETFLRPSEIIRQVLGERDVVALCGPSHAEEFTRRLPASVVVAGTNPSLLSEVQTLFTTDRFRVYTNRDIVGVELAAALKNVVAIAAADAATGCVTWRQREGGPPHARNRRDHPIWHGAGGRARDVRRAGRHRRPDHHLL